MPMPWRCRAGESLVAGADYRTLPMPMIVDPAPVSGIMPTIAPSSSAHRPMRARRAARAVIHRSSTGNSALYPIQGI